MRKLILIFYILILTSTASAQSMMNAIGSAVGSKDTKPTGVSFEIGIGFPDVKIDYSDTVADAVYSGYAFNAKTYVPLYFGSAGSIDFTLGGRFLSTKNSASSGLASEHSQQIGLNYGLRAKLFRISLGIENNLMQADHYWVGQNTGILSYSFDVLNSYVGMDFSINDNLKFALSYSKGTAVLPGSKTGLSNDANYTDSVLWFNFVYVTGDSFKQLLSKSFK